MEGEKVEGGERCRLIGASERVLRRELSPRTLKTVEDADEAEESSVVAHAAQLASVWGQLPARAQPGSLPAILGEMRGWIMMSRRLPNLCLHFCRRIISTSPWRWTHSSSQVRAWKARQQQLSATGGGASFGSRSREKRSFSDQQPNSPSPLHPNLRRYRQRPPSRCLGSVSPLSRSSRRQSVRQLTHRDSAAAVG